MFDINVMATLKLTSACLPLLRRNGGGSLVFVTSTAAHGTYPGGGGYAARSMQNGRLPRRCALELAGEPIRVTEIAPGMVKTEEFSLVRLGDPRAAEDGMRELRSH
jgi:NADP-dependent 3-hydroxy acid dehydrogenase YdfG